MVISRRLRLTAIIGLLIGLGLLGNYYAQAPIADPIVPPGEIISGGVSKDGIPALTDPEKLSAGSADWLSDDDYVLGIVRNGQARAYPLKILYRHEIINDTLGGDKSVVSYCPLTGSGIHFDGKVGNLRSDFGVSGMLWKSNLILYNRSGKESWWSQMLGRSVNGPHTGDQLTHLPIVETTWGTWKELYPNTKTLSLNTGYGINYQRFPYGNYEDLNAPAWGWAIPDKYIDDSLPPKRRVFGIMATDKAVAYPFDALGKYPVLNHIVDGEPLLIVHHADSRFSAAYERELNDQTLSFKKVDDTNRFPYTLRDSQTQSTWTLTGEAIDGPLKGAQLKQKSNAFVCFWFAWAAFYPEPVVFNGNEIKTFPRQASTTPLHKKSK